MGIAFSIREALNGSGTCLDCTQHHEDAYFPLNALCERRGNCGPPYKETPYVRVSGITFDVKIEIYNHKLTTPNGNGYDHIKTNYEPPYAVLKLKPGREFSSMGHDVTVDK